MDSLSKAIVLATTHHQGQTDKGGHPYILHPLRVMMMATTDEQRIVAVLHDTVEDTDLTLDDLRSGGFSEEIVSAVDCLTRRKKESYEDFIIRAKTNPIARMVKVYDIEDNKDLTRLDSVTDRDYERIKKYDRALKVLISFESNE